MITSFKINDYDILSDNRVIAQFSGLSQVDSAPSTATAGGSKRITSTVRSNRVIQITGYIKRDVAGFQEDLDNNWFVGEKLQLNLVSDGETYTEDCIIQDIYLDRYKSLVTYTIKIVCYSSFFYKSEETITGEATINLENCHLPQHNIFITHTLTSGETTFTVDFYGNTTVVLDADYDGVEAVIDCQEQTCYIDGVNKFYLVTEWQDGEYKETATIPANTTVTFKKTVRGVR
jgi:hypothetical protein